MSDTPKSNTTAYNKVGCENALEIEANTAPNVVITRDEPAAPPVLVWSILLCCVILGPLNFVLYKVMFTAYTEKCAFFVSQGVNIMYVIIGGFFLWNASAKGEITEEMRKIPHSKFMIMGLLDCCAGFLAAMGASNTSGASQQLLNQSLIPCTMFASWLILGTKSTTQHMIGACVILLGALIVIWPSLTSSSAAHSHALSVMIYFSSNIPYSASYVYKEYGFKNLEVHVLYLTQWVSIYQLLLGFLLAPLQLVPGLGSEHGMSPAEIADSFVSGIRCFLELDHECKKKNTFFLLIGYCLVNFVFNTTGLYLVKHGSATFNAISYAIILPLTTLAFSLPVLGVYQERFSSATLIGLVVVLIGFVLWKNESLFGSVETENTSTIRNNVSNVSNVSTIGSSVEFTPLHVRSDGSEVDANSTLSMENGQVRDIVNNINSPHNQPQRQRSSSTSVNDEDNEFDSFLRSHSYHYVGTPMKDANYIVEVKRAHTSPVEAFHERVILVSGL